MKLRFLVCLIFFLLATPAFAGETMLDKAKETYGFGGWPGKDGKLRQGLALREVDLSPYGIKSERNRLSTSGEMILRYGEKGAKRIAFDVALIVRDTVADAREELIKFLSACTVEVPTGNSLGLEVGDVCYAAKQDGSFKTIAFVRNNIYVKVSVLNPPAGSEATVIPDISAIAKKIDAEIKNAGEVDKTDDLNKPTIDELTAPGTAKAGTPVEVTLKVSDPKNENLTTHIGEGGAMVYEQDGKRYFKAEKPGEYTITVYIMNEHFFVVKKSITIKVEKSEK